MKMTAGLSLALGVSGVVAAFAACGTTPTEETYDLTREELMKPSACAGCHPDQTREWSGSMHAYASEDPVFLAMNARMQRETKGALGDFCVRCHAPMAVRTGATVDGLNLASLPAHLKGVTCFFCHSVDAIEGAHSNPLRLATDSVLRGAIRDPKKTSAHRAGYSAVHDREHAGSAALCGSCHDVMTPGGVHIERTFAEWKASLYANPDPGQQLACGKCHMDGRDGLAADVPGVGIRRVHDHSMPGVDVALSPFPEQEAQRGAVQSFLDGSLLTKLCVRPGRFGTDIEASLDNAFAGHGWPSGANQDRRAWVELVAYKGADVVFESGRVPDDKSVESAMTPDLFLLRDRIFDASGKEVHMFWEAARYTSSQLPPAVTADPRDPAFYHAVARTFVTREIPDRVTMRARIRPIDFDLVDDLVASGDLDPAVRARVPTFTLASSVLEWKSDKGFGCVP